ncbi:hypothetical protein D3C80_1712710 [compost metagenome]
MFSPKYGEIHLLYSLEARFTMQSVSANSCSASFRFQNLYSELKPGPASLACISSR